MIVVSSVQEYHTRKTQMKKILCGAMILITLVGCGGKSETKATTCTIISDNDGVKIEGKIKLENDGTYVTKQIQEVIITADQEEKYDMFVTSIKSMGFTEKAKNMSGVSYKLLEDKKKEILTEKIVVDITEVSGENYSTMTGGIADVSDGSIKIGLKMTVDNFEEQDFTCKAN